MEKTRLYNLSPKTFAQILKIIGQGDVREIFKYLLSIMDMIKMKYQEIKDFAPDYIRNNVEETDSPFYGMEFNFSDFKDVLNDKLISGKAILDNELNALNRFNEVYFSNNGFIFKVVDFGENLYNYLTKNKDIEKIKAESISVFFTSISEPVLEMKFCADFIFSNLGIDIPIYFDEYEIIKIIELLINKVEREIYKDKRPEEIAELVKERINELNLNSIISDEILENTLNNWITQIHILEEEEIEKIRELENERYPRPKFNYKAAKYDGLFKGLVNFFKKIFNLPIVKIELNVYENTNYYTDFIIERFNEDNELILETINFINDCSRTLTLCNKLLNEVGIDAEIVRERNKFKTELYTTFLTFDIASTKYMFNFINKMKEINKEIFSRKYLVDLINTKHTSMLKLKKNVYNQVTDLVNVISENNGNAASFHLKKLVNLSNTEFSSLFLNIQKLRTMIY